MKLASLPTNYILRSNDLIFDNDDKKYILKVKDLSTNNKPREKMITFGPKSLTSTELIAILLGVGTKKEEVLSMAQRILKEYGEKTVINETSPKKLSESLNIPMNKSCQIIACFELGRRFFEKKDGKPICIRTAKQAYQYLKNMCESKKEHLCGLYLDSRYQIVYEETISIGSLTSNIVHPREVFRPAIEHGAVAVILAHNHPSNSLKATKSDIDTTKQIIAAGKILGIDVLDHLIITKNKFISIMEEIKNDVINI